MSLIPKILLQIEPVGRCNRCYKRQKSHSIWRSIIKNGKRKGSSSLKSGSNLSLAESLEKNELDLSSYFRALQSNFDQAQLRLAGKG